MKTPGGFVGIIIAQGMEGWGRIIEGGLDIFRRKRVSSGGGV